MFRLFIVAIINLLFYAEARQFSEITPAMHARRIHFLSKIQSNHTRQMVRKAFKILDSGSCEHVYLDVGTNIGVQIRKLYDPEKYPYAKVKSIYNDYYGNSSRSNVCTFGIEANPNHTPKHQILESLINQNEDKLLIFSNTAANVHGGNVEFYIQPYEAKRFFEWGASLLNWDKHHKMVNVTAGSLPLADFIKLGINDRPGQTELSKVTMKIDIEGSEYTLIPTLITAGAMCNINFVMCEFHSGVTDKPPPNDFLLNVNYMMSQSFNCKTKFLKFDDETYADGNV